MPAHVSVIREIFPEVEMAYVRCGSCRKVKGPRRQTFLLILTDAYLNSLHVKYFYANTNFTLLESFFLSRELAYERNVSTAFRREVTSILFFSLIMGSVSSFQDNSRFKVWTR